MDEQIMKEMTKNHESLRTFESEAVIRPASIRERLKDKLHDNDVTNGSATMLSHITLNDMHMKMCAGCDGTNCTVKDVKQGRARPIGSPGAYAMFVELTPSMYSAAAGTSFADEKGVTLSVILDKLKVRKGDRYYTSFLKCANMNVDQDTIQNCANTFIMREMYTIMPSLVITDGLSTLRAMGGTGVLYGLPDKLQYGMIYEASVCNGHNLKVMPMYDILKVFTKEGDELLKCKGELYNQIKSAFVNTGYFE